MSHRWSGLDLFLTLWVQPRAARDEWLGLQGDAFKVRITAPPVEGRANVHLIRYLAALFEVPRSQVILATGVNGRRKVVRICRPVRLPAPLCKDGI